MLFKATPGRPEADDGGLRGTRRQHRRRRGSRARAKSRATASSAAATVRTPASRITDMVEKPKAAEAPSNLIISGRYILQPEIFPLLSEGVRGAGGEIQITDAMQRLMKQPALHRRQIRRPLVRLRLEDRLPDGQRRLRARPAGYRRRVHGRDQGTGAAQAAGRLARHLARTLPPLRGRGDQR